MHLPEIDRFLHLAVETLETLAVSATAGPDAGRLAELRGALNRVALTATDATLLAALPEGPTD